jgi:coproporphyrinogen III oxidase-like Fe-S oxidoreductase
MENLKFLHKELKLRKLYTEIVKKKGYGDAIYCGRLFNFFDARKVVGVEEIKSLWEGYFRNEKRTNKDLTLNLSVPFCRKKCEYCSLYDWKYAQASDRESFVQSLIYEIRIFKDVFRDIKFKCFRFGGGTPSLLKDKQLKGILKEITRSFAFADQAERSFECNPYDSSPAKMKILSDFGINRISIGVQSFDKAVLRGANRDYQNYDMVKKSIRDIRKYPVLEMVRADLLIGLWNDSPQTVMVSFRKLAEMNVDVIGLFPLTPIPPYLKKYFNNDKDLFDRQLTVKIHGFERLVKPVAAEFGYDFVPFDCAPPEKLSWDFILKKHQTADRRKTAYVTNDIPYDCITIGKGAWSMIPDTACYKNKGFLPSLEIHDEIKNSYKVFYLKNQHSKLWFLLGRIPNPNRIPISLYKKWFGADIRDDFKEPLDKLKRLGAIEMTKEVISLTAKSQEERFVHLLFFVDNQTILTELDRLHSKARVVS